MRVRAWSGRTPSRRGARRERAWHRLSSWMCRSATALVTSRSSAALPLSL